MLPLRASSIPARTPVLQCSAYRNSPFFYHQDLQQRRFPTNVPTADVTASSKRISSTSTSSRSSLTSSSVPSFSYRIGASFSAKHRRFIPKDDIFSFDPKKVIASETEIFTGRPNSGQDAFFVGSVGNSSNVAFGVADGVGGWSDSGIDSAHFSHGLCQWMAKIASDSEFSGRKCLWPQDLLKKAYKKIVGERKIDGGGSTACVATADAEGTLKVAK